MGKHAGKVTNEWAPRRRATRLWTIVSRSKMRKTPHAPDPPKKPAAPARVKNT